MANAQQEGVYTIPHYKFETGQEMDNVKIGYVTYGKLNADKSKYKIPAPWCPAGQVNGYQIVPLDSTEELWKEGRAMHHCAGAYDYRVAAGKCYMYSVRQGDNRLATVELVRKQEKVKPLQFEQPVMPNRPRR